MKRNLFPLVYGLILTGVATQSSGQAPSTTLVISQVFGGGNSSGATYKSDYIEIFNLSNTTINLTGKSVQYASATGTSWLATSLSGNLAAHTFYLIKESTGTSGLDLPAFDKEDTIGMQANSGKVALVNSTVALTGAQTNPNSNSAIIDFVGYGSSANAYEGTGPTTPSLTTTTAAFRTTTAPPINNYTTILDTNNNGSDFKNATPAPRNSSIQATPSLPAPLVVAMGMPLVSLYMRKRKAPAKKAVAVETV